MICSLGSPIRADMSKSMIPAWWSPGLTWNAHQEEQATGRSWDTQMASIRDFPREPYLKVVKVKGLGCAKRTASWREWAEQKAVRLDFWIWLLTSAMKMMESPVACQGARVAERSQKKAIQRQVRSPIDSKWQHC